ncbi:MAG: adenosine deaminase [Sphaerochaetaceae bacterium]|nr:adenosine deaminase [Sphaerochaetaceae bacterium]
MLTEEIIRKAPKVELHDHLDGGLRPSTVIDLAKKYKIKIPTTDEKELQQWFTRGCQQRSLALYLETFSVTISVMQTKEALERIAFEAVEDLAKENVVYAEIRFAPVLHVSLNLELEDVVLAVLLGLERGRRKTGMEYGLILCAMRNQSSSLSLEIAELAVAFRNRKVVGFDIAGDEFGHPPKKHLDAFQYIRNQNFNITIHAGEAFGLESIWQAIQVCGAQRIGHGTRLTEDMSIENKQIVKMGDLSHFILDKRIPLEMCLSSNVGTGAAKDFASHPFILFFRNNFRVFLCTDNRLMSDTSLTKEMMIASKEYDLNIHDLEKITINAMKSAFTHHDQILDLIFNSIKKGYASLREAYKL